MTGTRVDNRAQKGNRPITPERSPAPLRAPASQPPGPPDMANERFGFTLFLSIALHVVLILGVGFGIYDRMSSQPSMEITLAQYRSEAAPEEADFLAQENQSGSGTLEERAAPSTPVPAPFNDDSIQEVNPVQQQEARMAARELPSQEILASSAPAREQVRQQPEETNQEEAENPADQNRDQEEMSETIASLQAQLDLQRQAYAKRPRKYTISSASTQKARDALYLDAWRKKIEAVGNLNYPQQASRQRIYGSLRLLVALRPDGSVSDIRVLRSSGQRVLDDAAQQIVRLAAPFDAFPESMKQEVDILEIIRTWQFHPGDSLSSY